MKIAVVGPGSLGSLLAAFLAARTSHEVWLLDRNPARALFLNENGLVLISNEGKKQYAVHSTSDASDMGTADFIFLCVKSHHVSEALDSASPLFTPQSLLISFQNGISHIDTLRKTMQTPWGLGVTSLGASLIKEGTVRLGGMGKTMLGFLTDAGSEENARLRQVRDIMNSAGTETEISPDILAAIWNKLLVNAGINALTAIHRCPNGMLLENHDLHETLVKAVNEAAAVARAKGIAVVSDPVVLVEAVCRSTATNISSMLQDIRRKRRTEIDSINGAITAEAALLGIPAPINRELLQTIKEMENNYTH